MKNKNLIIIIISIIVLGLIGIGIYLVYPKFIPAKEISLNESFKLEARRRVLVDNKLEISLIEAKDGRCQEGWQCIWQGEIRYTIMVNDKKLDLGTVKTKSVDYEDYTITLDDYNDSTKYVRLKVEEKKEVITTKQSNNSTCSLGEVCKIPLNEEVLIDDNLKIELLEVDDSRCPDNTECYWEGELEYSLLVNGKTIKLGTVRDKDEDYKNYDIKLANNNSSSEYVLLIVEKDNDYGINDVDDDNDIDDEDDD